MDYKNKKNLSKNKNIREMKREEIERRNNQFRKGRIQEQRETINELAEELEKLRELKSRISSFIAEKRKQQDHVLLGELENLIKEL